MADNIRYVSRAGTDGWLIVTLENGKRESLPHCLKVRVYQQSDDREHFVILEGALKGTKASVRRKGAGDSYLISGIVHRPAGVVRFDRTRQMLWYGGLGPFNAFSGNSPGHTAVPTGHYKLQIPFAPSAETRPQYYAYTDFHKTWFRLGLNPIGDRFLHVGEISHGCVTVRAFVPKINMPQPSGFNDLPAIASSVHRGAIGFPLPSIVAPVVSWKDIYHYLIAARAYDQSVGTLTVV